MRHKPGRLGCGTFHKTMMAKNWIKGFNPIAFQLPGSHPSNVFIPNIFIIFGPKHKHFIIVIFTKGFCHLRKTPVLVGIFECLPCPFVMKSIVSIRVRIRYIPFFDIIFQATTNIAFMFVTSF